MNKIFPAFDEKKHVGTDNNLGVQWANQILEKTNEPMSIDQIRAKFDPLIPFQVRCVRDVMPSKEETPYRVSNGIPVNTIVTVNGLPDKHGHYPCDYKDNFGIGFWLHPGLEKWVLV